MDQSMYIKWTFMHFSLFCLLTDCTSKGCCLCVTMDATKVWWHIKLGTQLPLYQWLPHHPTGLGPPREECSIQIPVIFVHHKKPQNNQTPNQNKATQQNSTSKRNIFIPKCSRKGMGSGNIAIQSEDFILPLMLFSYDLELSVLSIPLFSVWVQG